MNANECLNNVNELIVKMEVNKNWRYGYGNRRSVRIADVCSDLGIFDWWDENLSLSQLKKMKRFLERSIALGFDKYVCFKVGAKHCSHGMWAHKDESTDGYSPDGDCLFHSFRAGENYWDAKLNGEWLHDRFEATGKDEFTHKEIKGLVALANLQSKEAK